MKRREVIFVMLLFAVFMATNNQAFAQSDGKKSDRKIEMIGVYLPDSIVFKPAAGVEIKSANLQASIVSGSESFTPKSFNVSGQIGLMDGGYKYLENSILKIELNYDSSFKPQKIKFTVDKQDIIYDIATSEWE